jgi:dihydroorotase
MHEGEYSRKYGIPGIPTRAETSIIRRDAELAERTGAAAHIQHITAGESMDILREFQARGVRISGEVSPHHLALCDADIDPHDANYKMNPPLRSAHDRNRLTEGLLDGTAAIFATDHAPHPAAAKQKGWLEGPFGVLGLETAVGITYSLLVKTGRLALADWIARWTTRPAALLGRPAPSLAPGQPADIVLLDLEKEWTVDPEQFLTKSRNTPFAGWTLTGSAARTWLHGRPTWTGA